MEREWKRRIHFMSYLIFQISRVGDTLVHRVFPYPHHHTKIETITPTSTPPSKPNQLLQKQGYTDNFWYLALTTRPRLRLLIFLWADAQPTCSTVFALVIQIVLSSTYMDCGKISSCCTVGLNLLKRRLYTLFIRHPHGRMNYKDTEP